MAVADYEKRVAQLKRAIADKQAKLDAVEQRRAASQQMIDKHHSARSAHVMGARVNNDPQAQQQLNELHDRIEAAQREQRDDDAALALLRPGLQTMRSALEIAELNIEREYARELIRARINANLEQEVVGLVLKVKELIEKIRSSNSEIGRAVFAFDDKRGTQLMNAQAAPFRLDAGFIPLNQALDSFATSSVRFERLLDQIEDVNVPGEPEEVAVG